MTHPDSSPGVHLRLLRPQWQGAGTSSVEALASEFPLDVARRGYAVGTAVLEAVLPPHVGPIVTVPVTMSDDGLEERDGVEAKAVVLEQLECALEIIRRHDPARIATLGGECSVSVAPFAELARRYGDDLAIVWIDSHPDIGTPDRVALVGLHSWTDDDIGNVAAWGIRSFSPGELRESTRPLLDWIATTGCSRVAIHFDVDAIDSDEAVPGLGILDGFPLISA